MSKRKRDTDVDVETLQKYEMDRLFKVHNAPQLIRNKNGNGNIEEKDYQIIIPNYDANLILSHYYLLKYGIKIAVNESDSAAILSDEEESFITAKFKETNDFKFALVMCSNAEHKFLAVFEKKGEENFLILMDSIASNCVENYCVLLSAADEAIPNLQIIVPENMTAILQASDKGCTTYALSMAKDALRIPSVIEEFKDTNCQIKKDEDITDFNVSTFNRFPAQFMKYAETSRATNGINLEEINIVRSSPNKEAKTLHDYRLPHSIDQVYANSTIVRENRNNAIYSKHHALPSKVNKVLTYYNIDETSIDDFIEKLKTVQNMALMDTSFTDRINGQSALLQEVDKIFPEKELREIPSWSRITPLPTARHPSSPSNIQNDQETFR